jgi:O-acetylhomoserine (thiol)-lyase
MERHSQNALAVAKHLEQHPGVEWVNYPGLESSRYHARAKKYLPNGPGVAGHLRHQGRLRGGKKLINSLEAVLAAGQHRRRQIAGDSSRLHHAPAALREEQASHRRHAGTGAALGWH